MATEADCLSSDLNACLGEKRPLANMEWGEDMRWDGSKPNKFRRSARLQGKGVDIIDSPVANKEDAFVAVTRRFFLPPPVIC